MDTFRLVEIGTEIVTYLMLISGIPPCLEAYRTRDSTKMNFSFCLLGLMNAVAGIIYGRLLKLDSLITINKVCVLFQSVFVIVLIIASRSKGKHVTQASVAVIFMLLFTQYLMNVVVKENVVLEQLGFFMFIVAIITWSTPALEIKEIVRKKSSADISISLLIGSIACTGMWCLYGLMLKDFFIYARMTVFVGNARCIDGFGRNHSICRGYR